VGAYSHLYGAIGAAILYLEESAPRKLSLRRWEDIFVAEQKKKVYGFPPLRLELATYPEFESTASYLHQPKDLAPAVEVDVYAHLKKKAVRLSGHRHRLHEYEGGCHGPAKHGARRSLYEHIGAAGAGRLCPFLRLWTIFAPVMAAHCFFRVWGQPGREESSSAGSSMPT